MTAATPHIGLLSYIICKVLCMSTEDTAHFTVAFCLVPIKLHTEHRALVYHSPPPCH